MNLIPLLLFTASVFAGVSGRDDRVEARAPEAPALYQELARSVPAIVENKMLKAVGDGFVPDGYSMERMNFCPGVRFSGQTYLARCSASLIGEDLILTAGHCVDDDLRAWCQNYSIVFDYAVGEGDTRIAKENVFACREVIYRQFVGAFDEDLALVKLTRKVPGRTPVTVARTPLKIADPLFMIGYPLGLPQKVVDDGSVLQFGPSKYSFRHKLDTFSSNSGGPLFNFRGEQVGVLVRGTGPNQEPVPGKKCFDWGRDKESDYAEANSLLHLNLTQ